MRRHHVLTTTAFRPALLVAVVGSAVALALSGCSSSAKSASSTTTTVAPATTVAATTSTVPTLTEQIARNWEGAQIDTVGVDNPPTALLSGLVVHHGTWWAALNWGIAGKTGPNWCGTSVGTWKVLAAQSLSQFKVAYYTTHATPPCGGTASKTPNIITVTGSHQQNGHTVYSIKYSDINAVGTRTVCSPMWNTPHPCGVTTGIKLPTPPTP